MDKEHHKQILLKHFKAPFPQHAFELHLIQEEEAFDCSQISYGLVAYCVVWSAYTFSNGKKVLQEIIKNASRPVPIYLLDCDFISPETQKRCIGFLCHGYFESAWIEQEQIVSRHHKRPEFDPFIQRMVAGLK